MILLQIPAGEVAQDLNVIDLLMKGGVVMIPILLLSVIAIILIVERSLYLSKNAAVRDSSLKELADTPAGDAQFNFCRKQNNAWGQVFSYGVTAASQEESDRLMEDAANVEVARMEKNLNYLTIIAGVAPLLGFVGTIIGVITIFFDISVSQDISISVISAGLYKKMVTSAAGLMVGIIAYCGYHLLHARIDTFINHVQQDALNFRMMRHTPK